MVMATFEVMSVIIMTPKKLKTAAISTAGFGAIALVETQVAIAFGASVQPFTNMTPNVRIAVISKRGF
ncbi:hypothetical protein SDC9_84504 [bioreactor metagenome]|uniref:Uncharacterized protein n=1 Tax=bioreactor metagenome TaxID=1076179 RepID=A0A644ZJE2_9ZZZZ